jgi:hypothetical protein
MTPHTPFSSARFDLSDCEYVVRQSYLENAGAFATAIGAFHVGAGESTQSAEDSEQVHVTGRNLAA